METDNLKEFELKYNCFTKATNGFWEYVNLWKMEKFFAEYHLLQKLDGEIMDDGLSF